MTQDGWAHLAAVIDGHDREVIGHEFALRGRAQAKEAEWALGEVCLERFGTLRTAGATPVVRSDNGLIYQSRRFRAACRDYRLAQEFITTHTPEQNGLIERFFRNLKAECVWQHSFVSCEHARRELNAWIRGTTRSAPIGRWAIGARASSGRKKSLRCLDSTGAVHCVARIRATGSPAARRRSASGALGITDLPPLTGGFIISAGEETTPAP